MASGGKADDDAEVSTATLIEIIESGIRNCRFMLIRACASF
jgi:hypothetical protein